MALGLKIKSFIPFKQGGEGKSSEDLPGTKIPGMGKPLTATGVQAKSPLPVAPPLSSAPQGGLAAATPVQNVIPMPPPSQAAATSQPPAAEATPAPDDQKKGGKDVMNLFIEEEAKVTQTGNLAAALPEIDMAKLYSECLDCKKMLG